MGPKASSMSLQSQSLGYWLLLAFALIFVLPALILFDLPVELGIVSDHNVAFRVVAALATAGLGFALMRIAVDHIRSLASRLRESALTAAAVEGSPQIQELREITSAFNELLVHFRERDAGFGRRVAEVEALKEVALIDGSEGAIDDLLKLALDKALLFTDARTGVVWRVLPEEGSIEVHVVRGEGLRVGDRFPVGRGLVSTVLTGGWPLSVVDAAGDPRRDPAIDGPLGGGAVLYVPVLVDDEPVAVFSLGQKWGSGVVFSPQDRDWVSAMGARVGLAVEREELHVRIRQGQEELVEVNARLVESERAATFARTVVELTHQINSPLSVISSCTELVGEEAARADWEVADSLQAVQDECQRIADVLSRMREAADATPPGAHPNQEPDDPT